MNNEGFTLVGSLIAMAIVGIGLAGFGTAVGQSTKREKTNRDRATVQAYISEVLETFRSLGSASFYNNYYRVLPQAYPLCSHINLLDRNTPESSPIFFNPDPNVNLPVTFLQVLASPASQANRFYQVTVVDTQTLRPNPAPCQAGAPLYVYDPNAGERFMVTVGISWLDKTGGAQIHRRETLSTVLYEK